jgi:ABC-type antimicrobial peptide transport system permease subunit
MVIRRSLWLSVTGTALGLALALSLGRFAANLLHGIRASDPLALAAACAIMLGLAVLASFVPAIRASRIDPMTALRYE